MKVFKWRARTAAQNRMKLYRRLRARSAVSRRPMYTTNSRYNSKVGPSGPRRITSPRDKPDSKNWRDKKGYRQCKDLSVSQQAQWAQSEFVHLHAKSKDFLRRTDWHLFQEILGLDGADHDCWKHASHAGTRRRLAEALAGVVSDETERSAGQAYFITIIHDGWRTSLEQPEISLVAIRQLTRDCLKFLEFEGIAVIEFDVIESGTAGTHEYVLAPHVHAVGYLPDNYRGRLKRLRRSRRLSSAGGAKTIDCRNLKELRDVKHAAAYMVKPALWVKRLVPRREKAGYKLLANRNRDTFVLARLAEILSYTSFKDLMLTRGKKSGWLTDALALASNGSGKREQWLTWVELDAFWRAFWTGRGYPHFSPVKLIK